jgi:hypothetical protein
MFRDPQSSFILPTMRLAEKPHRRVRSHGFLRLWGRQTGLRDGATADNVQTTRKTSFPFSGQAGPIRRTGRISGAPVSIRRNVSA